MAFRGLFIGIDKYASSEISELSCACRDAVALEALFSDTLGGTTVLVTDADATRERLRAEFGALATCDPEDTVVIAYAGHGSDTHELATYDAELEDLKNTAIPLELLEEWFSRIPAKRLVFFLDCCFSGGMGARVLHAPIQPRDMRSADSKLAQLAGNGRIVFTASSATEEALEDRRRGHGLLSYFLMEALRGAEEVTSGGRISLYQLLSYITERVKAASQKQGRIQTPTMRGSIDGDVHWPVFAPGPKYLSAFPDRAPAEVTSDLTSLVAVGFPEKLIEAWGGNISRLNPLQLSAINDFGVLEGHHLVVSAPTSSGKTMIGELAALKHALERRRALFLLPLKALVADKRRHFEALYGGFGIRTIEATGETDDIGPLLRGQYDVALLTYEKFAAIVLGFPHVLAQAGVIVVDEAQMIADKGRGANLEFILTLIRMRRREEIEPQVIALSAVIGDTNGFESWLEARLLRRDERPVPLDEGLLLADGQFRYIDADTRAERVDGPIISRDYGKGSSQDWIKPLIRKLVADRQQVIVFRETKGDARGAAKYLANLLGLPAATEAIAQLPAGDPSFANADLRMCLERGVAFHISDLHREERRIVEEEFRRPDSKIRVIAATTTLAMGVNTPAASVVIAGLEHPGPDGPVPYTVAEYKNLVGRAGRLGYAERGTSYLLATDYRTEHNFWERYVMGTPEDLTSRFLHQDTDPASLIVRVLVGARRAAGQGVTAGAIVAFLEASFGAFQAARSSEGWKWNRDDLVAALKELEQHDLVRELADDTYELTELGKLAGESATEVRSIVRLVDGLRPLSPEDINDPTLIAITQVTLELDGMYFPINKVSTRKEPSLWPQELRQQSVSTHVLEALRRDADTQKATVRAKKAVACLLYVSGRPMNEIERVLTQFGGAFDGVSGPIRGVSERTCDLLPVAARVAEILHPDLRLEDRVDRLTVRLTHGIPSAVTDLAREAGNALLREDYCQLAVAGLTRPDELEAATDTSLLACIGGSELKLHTIRDASARMKARQERMAKATTPILEPYVG